MYLIDTDVISELRKGGRADAGVQAFFKHVADAQEEVFLSVITLGELRRGIERIRARGDERQARRLATWFDQLLDGYAESVLEIDAVIAQVWGHLRARHPENALDKLIAATALVHDLTVVTRNERHFRATAAPVLNPFREG